MNPYSAILYSALYAMLNVGGATLIKSEISNRILANAKDYISLLLTPKVIMGFGIIGISALVLFKALSIARFSYVIPVANGINFAFTVIVGYFIFSDKITYITLIGMALILSGIIILGVTNKNV
jgi:multidrug transporter EmrE-like cation transporter